MRSAGNGPVRPLRLRARESQPEAVRRACRTPVSRASGGRARPARVVNSLVFGTSCVATVADVTRCGRFQPENVHVAADGERLPPQHTDGEKNGNTDEGRGVLRRCESVHCINVANVQPPITARTERSRRVNGGRPSRDRSHERSTGARLRHGPLVRINRATRFPGTDGWPSFRQRGRRLQASAFSLGSVAAAA